MELDGLLSSDELYALRWVSCMSPSRLVILSLTQAHSNSQRGKGRGPVRQHPFNLLSRFSQIPLAVFGDISVQNIYVQCTLQ